MAGGDPGEVDVARCQPGRGQLRDPASAAPLDHQEFGLDEPTQRQADGRRGEPDGIGCLVERAGIEETVGIGQTEHERTARDRQLEGLVSGGHEPILATLLTTETFALSTTVLRMNT